MGKCLITKLDGSINNNSLLKLGEFRISIGQVSNPSLSTNAIVLEFTKNVDVEIIGNGYFTDQTFSANRGKKLTIPANVETSVFYSNGDYDISILNKYAIKTLSFYQTNTEFSGNLAYDLENLKYSTSLNYLNLSTPQVTGDIAALKNLTSLIYIDLHSSKVKGDIAALKNLTSLIFINLSIPQVTGDISALKNLTSLTNIYLSTPQVTGDISAISNLTSLSTCIFGQQVTGDISAISRLSNLKRFSVGSVSGDITAINNTKLTKINISNANNLTGDIARLKSDFVYLGFNDTNTPSFTWTSRDSESFIFGNSGYPKLSSNIDDVLINISQCRNGITSSSEPWETLISYQGNRTSASDAAVEILQGYGYNVRINKV